ncbi:MAG: hypothetical protein U0797_11055 [Gemmataceae bacterium]
MPLDDRPFVQTRLAIYTRRSLVTRAVGGTVFVVVSLGSPKRYFLWECFEIAEVRGEGGQFCAWGDGWQLAPPVLLAGEEFSRFRRACAYFVGFRSITELPFTRTLIELARRSRAPALTPAVGRFCDLLVEALPASGDVRFARGFVHAGLGRHAEALADLDAASRLGTEYPDAVADCRRRTLASLGPSKVIPT